MQDFVLSLVMLAALALVAGAFVLWRRSGAVKQPALMVLLAVIAVINVLIWTIPASDGRALLEQIKDGQAG
jgi:drug/metabolite transporter superfamily protein YnfA